VSNTNTEFEGGGDGHGLRRGHFFGQISPTQLQQPLAKDTGFILV
jgi:hypothetical protein